MPKAQAAASCVHAERAAVDAIAAGGSAVDAVVAAFFASAGADSGTLLGPMVALVGGVGVGARAFDGRCLQPGRGLRRPRGLRTGEAVPPAARAAVPRAPATALLLHAYGGSLPLRQLLAPARSGAAGCGCPGRAALLGALAGRGASALRAPEVVRALVARAGAAHGGTLTAEDLEEAVPGDDAAEAAAWGLEHRIVVPTFVRDAAPGETAPGPGGRAEGPAGIAEGSDPSGARCHVAVAADGRGVVAALAYGPDPDGIEIPDLQLRLSRGAIPVRRGVPRLRPGAPLPARAPIALVQRPPVGWFSAVGSPEASSLSELPPPVGTTSLRGLLEWLTRDAPGTGALGASVQRRRTSLVRLPSRAP